MTTCNNHQTVREHNSKSDYTRWRNIILSNHRRGTSRGHTSCIPFCSRPQLRYKKKTYQGQSQRVPPTIVTDLDFADDLAMITEETEHAQEVLTRLEQEAGKVGLHCNAKKTQIQAFNHDTTVTANSRDGII